MKRIHFLCVSLVACMLMLGAMQTSAQQTQKGNWKVVLEEVGDDPVKVIQLLREELGLRLNAAKGLVDSTPCTVLDGVKMSVADALVEKLEKAGAKSISKINVPCDLVLEAVGNREASVIKLLKEELGITLIQAKQMVDTAPCVVLSRVEEDLAKALAKELEAFGATVRLDEYEFVLASEATWEVILESVGSRRSDVVREIRDVLGVGLKEANDWADLAPATILDGVTQDFANEFVRRLTSKGAKARSKSILSASEPKTDIASTDHPRAKTSSAPAKSSTSWKVKLVDKGANATTQVAIITLLKEELGLRLNAAKGLVDAAPCVVLDGVRYEKAKDFAEKLQEAGATASYETSTQPLAEEKSTAKETPEGKSVVLNAKNFPDRNFRLALVEIFKIREGETITGKQIGETTELNLRSKGISDLRGIEHFEFLEALYCNGNFLSTLNISSNTRLTYLDCNGNRLSALDVSGCRNLETLNCSGNQMSSLNIAGCSSLVHLDCNRNQLRGVAMDMLIANLPVTSTGILWLLNPKTLIPEGNVCTKSQVAAARAKGWRPRYFNVDDWADYEGQ